MKRLPMITTIVLASLLFILAGYNTQPALAADPQFGLEPPVNAQDGPLGSHMVGRITFSQAEIQGQPQNASDQFIAGTDQIYAFFQYRNLTKNDVVAGIWHRGARTLARQRHTLGEILGDNPPSSGTLWFSLEVDGGLTPGFYTLEVSLNNQLEQVGTFCVAPKTSKPTLVNVAFVADLPGNSQSVTYPVVAKSTYSEGTQHIYAVFDYFGMNSPVRWGWQLSRDGVTLREVMYQPWTAGREGSFAFPLEVPPEPGLYDVHLFVDGKWAAEQSFRVGRPMPATDRLLFSDNFSNPRSGWTVVKDDEGKVGYERGKYVVTLKSLIPYWGSSKRNLRDFILEVDATPLPEFGKEYVFDGPLGDIYGVVVRAQDNSSFYACVIDSDGRYAVFHIERGKLIWDVPWTVSDEGVINPDWATNHFRILAKGSEIRFYVNDHFLARVDNAVWMSGSAGVLAASTFADTLGPAKVGFENWNVWALPKERPQTGEDYNMSSVSSPAGLRLELWLADFGG